MNVMALFNPIDWLMVLIDPRSWGIAAVAVFAWRPFLWPRRLLVALAVYLVLAVLIERGFGTFFGGTLYAQFVLGLVATALWFWVLQLARQRLAAEK
jgi:hypothetical protein